MIRTSAIKRRRECKNCKKRYTTYERPEEVSLTVVKSDSRRENFDRKKLREGIARACEKRPISSETIDKIVSEVETELSDYLMEVPSAVIGDKVLTKLWDIDAVAYIRFASVYKNFADIETFMQEIKTLKKKYNKKNNK